MAYRGTTKYYGCGHRRIEKNTVERWAISNRRTGTKKLYKVCKICYRRPSPNTLQRSRERAEYFKSRRVLVDGKLVSIECPTELHGRAGGYNYYYCRCTQCLEYSRNRRKLRT